MFALLGTPFLTRLRIIERNVGGSSGQYRYQLRHKAENTPAVANRPEQSGGQSMDPERGSPRC